MKAMDSARIFEHSVPDVSRPFNRRPSGMSLGTVLIATMFVFVAYAANALERGAIWLGLTGCNADVHFSLRLSAPEGEITGQIVGDIAEHEVAGRFVDGRLELEPGNWLKKRSPPNGVLKGLSGTFLEEHDLIVGTFTNGGKCPSFVAKRIDVPDTGSNPDGLLSRLAPRVRPKDVLNEQACQTYIEWRLSGAPGSSIRGGRFDTAAGNHSGMQQALGKDIFDWTGEDARNIRLIGQTCRGILRNGQDPKSTELWAEVRARGGGFFPNPLDKMPFGRPWQSLMLFLYPEVVGDLQASARMAEEGLLQATAEGQSSPAAALELVGMLTCTRGDRYLRITIPDTDAATARIEFGPGLENLYARGALTARGTFDPKGFHFEPEAWLHKPIAAGASIPPFGLEGRRSGTDKFSGQTIGLEECPSFRVYLTDPPRDKLNPDGLLFKVVGLRTAQLSTTECLRFLDWLADSETVSYGSFRMNALALDSDRIWTLFGKEPQQWGGEDHQRYRSIVSVCRSMFRNSTDVDLSQKLALIETFDVTPLEMPKENWRVNDWVQLALVPIVNREALDMADADYNGAKILQVALSSFEKIDTLIGETNNLRGRLKYLTVTQRENQIEKLRLTRDDLGQALAVDAISRFDEHPATLPGLLNLEVESTRMTEALREKSALNAAAFLNSAYLNEAQARALTLWPVFLDRAKGVHQAHAESGYLEFKNLQALRSEEAVLSRFAAPQSSEELRKDYQDYKAQDHNLAHAMVRRSETDLIAWIGAMEPSATANELMSTFVTDTFSSSHVPDEFPELQSTVREKRAAYNPQRMRRPDIVLALARAHWSEVQYRGLDNLAYFTTAFREVSKSCAGLLPSEGGAEFLDISSFVISASQDSMRRFANGEATRADAQRGVFVFLNLLFNQPGCTLDMFGNPTTNCTTPEESQAGFEAAMYSFEATADIQSLLRSGCGDPTLNAFVEGYSKFAAFRPFTGGVPAMNMPELEEFLSD